MKVYPPRDICPFVMYCINGKPRSSLLIESTYSMILYCTIFYITILHCSVLYGTLLCCIVLYYIVLYNTVYYYIILYCMHSIVLYCIVLYYTVQYCILLYYTVRYCIILKTEKTFKNEQRSKDAAAKKRPNTSGVGNINNYYEDIYIPPNKTPTSHTYTL